MEPLKLRWRPFYPDVRVPLSEIKWHCPPILGVSKLFVSNASSTGRSLDQVLKIAAAHGDKVIPVLANQYNYCDGNAKDLAWYQTGYRTEIGPGDIVTYQDLCRRW